MACLYVWCSNVNLEKRIDQLKNEKYTVDAVNTKQLKMASYGKASFNLIVFEDLLDFRDFTKLLGWLKLDGKLYICKSTNVAMHYLELELKLSGFVNITSPAVNSTNDEQGPTQTMGILLGSEPNCALIALKPSYEVGASVKLLSLGKTCKSSTVWELNGDENDDANDLIDEDDLLDDVDKQKPDPSSLKVCGTTGKRKPCKDCTCGLAEEFDAEASSALAKVAQISKPSCGSCYLGDAFRCANCPYLGMPAFKPGQKVRLPKNLLSPDVIMEE